jgi:hypothetical protein
MLLFVMIHFQLHAFIACKQNFGFIFRQKKQRGKESVRE